MRTEVFGASHSPLTRSAGLSCWWFLRVWARLQAKAKRPNDPEKRQAREANPGQNHSARRELSAALLWLSY
jgi:hypothetical protein